MDSFLALICEGQGQRSQFVELVLCTFFQKLNKFHKIQTNSLFKNLICDQNPLQFIFLQKKILQNPICREIIRTLPWKQDFQRLINQLQAPHSLPSKLFLKRFNLVFFKSCDFLTNDFQWRNCNLLSRLTHFIPTMFLASILHLKKAFTGENLSLNTSTDIQIYTQISHFL